MKYLFFDIECSDGKHICAFGYVIVDKNFNIIEKKDIAINPKWGFRKGRAGFDPRTDLAYSVEYFRKQKSFDYHYENIKKILLLEDTIVLGHAVSSDLSFLRMACDRYNLPQIQISAYDTQNIYYQYNKQHYFRSLENIAKDLELDISNLSEHKSCDDAEISMLITKGICKNLGTSLDELLELCEKSVKNVKNKSNKKSSVYNSVSFAIKDALNKKGITIEDFEQ